MRKIILLLLLGLAVALLADGCASDKDKGSREYIPGKGWVPT